MIWFISQYKYDEPFFNKRVKNFDELCQHLLIHCKCLVKAHKKIQQRRWLVNAHKQFQQNLLLKNMIGSLQWFEGFQMPETVRDIVFKN